MLKRKFGWTGVNLPIVGQGTWQLEQGSAHHQEKQAIETLQIGLDLGMTHIDTAEMYGNGRVEELVWKAIGERRDEVFLVDKVLPSNASYEGTLKACKRSLERLKTNWIDLYLLHWPSDRNPIKETMRAMEKLVDDGVVRFIGVSNFDVAELRKAEQSLSKHRIACDQVLYNLQYREIERHLLPYCNDRQIATVGYSPFGHGTFPSPSTNQGKVLERIAKAHNHTARQVALNFLTRHQNLFTIPKAGEPKHVRENANSSGWSLTEDDISAIDRAFPIQGHEGDPLQMI